jgi:hypothetical protein
MQIAILRNEQMQELVDRLACECTADEKMTWCAPSHSKHVSFVVRPCSRATFVRVLKALKRVKSKYCSVTFDTEHLEVWYEHSEV